MLLFVYIFVCECLECEDVFLWNFIFLVFRLRFGVWKEGMMFVVEGMQKVLFQKYYYQGYLYRELGEVDMRVVFYRLYVVYGFQRFLDDVRDYLTIRLLKVFKWQRIWQLE